MLSPLPAQIGSFHLADKDFSWITEKLCEIQPRIVSCLEGGYAVSADNKYALGTAGAAHVRALVTGAHVAHGRAGGK